MLDMEQMSIQCGFIAHDLIGSINKRRAGRCQNFLFIRGGKKRDDDIDVVRKEEYDFTCESPWKVILSTDL